MRYAVAALLVLLAACEPLDMSGEVPAWVVDRDDSGEYALVKRTLVVDSFRDLTGPTIRSVARAKIEVASDGSQLLFLDGSPLGLRYSRAGDAWAAEDYDGLILLSFYHHATQVHAYFRDLGLGTTTTDLGPLPAHYLPQMEALLGLRIPLITDNAAFLEAPPSFLVFRELLLDEIPLPANAGVVAHEFGHAVFHHLAVASYGAERVDQLGFDDASFNFIRSVNEGLSDVHGAAFTRDPKFIVPSVSKLEERRDVSRFREYTQELEDAALGTAPDEYDPYPLGDVLANTFWAFRGRLVERGMSEEEAIRRMAEVAFEATRVTDLTRLDHFEIATFMDTAAQVITDPQEHGLYCEEVAARFGRVMERIPGCQP
ncbi:MAG: hypothetical protein D6729_05600 [Deltaproteobacteria bacterium]|nr:MAG: hypothetical protein D6729_05600 [Deltaproteobacteria bacterium]